MTIQRQNIIVVFLALTVSGCGDSVTSSSRTMMTEPQHSHYHVHAVDASHEHVHDDTFGGHVHSHQHSD